MRELKVQQKLKKPPSREGGVSKRRASEPKIMTKRGEEFWSSEDVRGVTRGKAVTEAEKNKL